MLSECVIKGSGVTLVQLSYNRNKNLTSSKLISIHIQTLWLIMVVAQGLHNHPCTKLK